MNSYGDIITRARSAETMILFNDMIRVGDCQNFLEKLGARES